MTEREIRTDPITGEDVVLASGRRVERVPPRPPDPGLDACPFCPGRESDTRPTIDQRPTAGAWVARAFANHRPALVVEERPVWHREGVFERLSGTGAHEVLVECPEHRALHELPVHRTEVALELARARITDLRQDRRLRVLQWFRNHGTGGSASQPHPHAQVVALPFVPERVRRIAERSTEHRMRTGGSLLGRVVAAEVRDGRRLVATRGGLVAFCPFAPQSAFEVWIAPEVSRPCWADVDDREAADLAALSHEVIRRLVSVLGDVPYRAAFVGAAEGGEGEWHWRLAPHLVVPGGLEVATGISVHGVFPEESASLLRSAL